MSEEYIFRICRMYDYIESYNYLSTSRKRKSYIRKIFNLWYQCPNCNGEYNDEFWNLYLNYKDNKKIRKFLLDNSKALTIYQFGCMLREISNRINKR